MKTGILNPIFSSFLYVEDLSLDLKTIKDYCLKLKSDSAGRKISNIHGWQSEDLQGEIPELNDLFLEMDKHLNIVAANIPVKKGKRLSLLNSWININDTPGCYNKPHSHPGSMLSGVFYTDDFDDSNITFINPSPAHAHVFDGSNINDTNEFTSGFYYIKPRSNRMIIFPSYLQHYVEPSNSSKSRITIAFNSSN